MDDEGKWWVTAVALVALAFLGTVGGCTVHQDRMKAQVINTALENGGDPIRATCAFREATNGICLINAAGGPK